MEMQTRQTTVFWKCLENLANCHFPPTPVQVTVWGTYTAPDLANSDLHYLLTVPAG